MLGELLGLPKRAADLVRATLSDLTTLEAEVRANAAPAATPPAAAAAIDVSDGNAGSSDSSLPPTEGAPSSSASGAVDLTISSAASAASRNVSTMKRMLYGTPEAPPDKQAASELASEILRTELLEMLLRHLVWLPFECRKDTTQIFSNLLRKHSNEEPSAAGWVEARPHLLLGLLRGCENPAVALVCGSMLRESVRHERLAALLFKEPSTFPTLCGCIESPHFDVASDAYATTRDLLTKHRATVASFLETQYASFFEQYMRLVRSDNYVTKRQSLKLLGELLLDRSNFAIMTRYISDPDHLKAVMSLLRDPSAAIQFEAFHVFKIFVANPRKEGTVLDLLRRNKDRLLLFLGTFLSAREAQDENFRDEKTFLVEEIQKL